LRHSGLRGPHCYACLLPLAPTQGSGRWTAPGRDDPPSHTSSCFTTSTAKATGHSGKAFPISANGLPPERSLQGRTTSFDAEGPSAIRQSLAPAPRLRSPADTSSQRIPPARGPAVMPVILTTSKVDRRFEAETAEALELQRGRRRTPGCGSWPKGRAVGRRADTLDASIGPVTTE
jgi:hypothetical protein